jgi:competence protein ComFC
VYSIKHSKEGRSFDFVAEQFRELLIPEMRANELLPKDCVITYLPRSHKNKAKDGFDQSYMLAKSLSKVTGIEFLPCFKRRLVAKEQKSLNSFERRLNMRSAYTLRDIDEEIKDKTVILVDDIVTTGSSMASCARLLYSKSAFAVMGVCVGLTRKEKNSKK